MKNRWYLPQTGWDYFFTLGMSVNVVVALILVIAYLTR